MSHEMTDEEARAHADLAEKAEKERIAAEQAAAKKAEKERVAAEKAAKKLAEKEAKEALKLAAKEAKEAEKAKKLADKEAAKAAKEAAKQPMQNGVRRPGPDGLCGRVWALADKLSAEMNQAVPVGDLLKASEAFNFNPSNVRAEYARWKKFHGLTGRIVRVVPATTGEQAAA